MTITWSLVIILGYDTIDWNRWFKKFELAGQWILKKDTSHSFNFQRASEILGFSDVCHLRCFSIHLFINHAFQRQKKHPGWRSVQGNGASAKSKANWNMHYWLVVDLPLWKIWKSVGSIMSNIWKNKSHVPNHQPDYFSWKTRSWVTKVRWIQLNHAAPSFFAQRLDSS